MRNRTIAVATVFLAFSLANGPNAQTDPTSTHSGLERLALASPRPDGSLDGIATLGGVQPAAAQLDALRQLGLQVQGLQNIPVALVRGSRAALLSAVSQGLADDVYPNDPIRYASVASDASINANKVQAMGIDGSGVGVAVVDSGIDATHPDLAKRVKHNVKIVDASLCNNTGVCGTPVTAGTFFVPVDQGPLNDSDTSSGHGTHCAGIVAADNTDGQVLGVAPGADLIGYGMGDAVFVFSAMVAYDDILKHRTDWNIRVTSNSWGSSFAFFDPNDPINQATKAAHDAGIVVVFAAGNDTTEMSIGPNSVAPWVISVGAGSLDRHRADFSSGGLQYDDSQAVNLPPDDFKHLAFTGDRIGIYHPSISAPGVNIVSTSATTGTVVAGGPGGTATASGTSMACPHVAGVAALLLQKKPSLTPDQVKTILEVTSGLMPDTSDSTKVQPFWQSGYGWVDAKAAIDFVSQPFNANKLNRLQRTADASVQGDRDYKVLQADYFSWTASFATVNGTPDTRDISLAVTTSTKAVKAIVSYPSLSYLGANPFDYQLTLTDGAGAVVATSTASDIAGVSEFLVDLTQGSWAYGQPWNLHVSGNLGAQDQGLIMGTRVSLEVAQLAPQARVTRTMPVFTPTGSASYYFQPGPAGPLTSPEGCNEQAGAPVGGMATARNAGTCQTGNMGYATNYAASDPAVFTSAATAADMTVGGSMTVKIYSVDPAQSAWQAAQSPFITVDVDALDGAGNLLEPIASAQFDVCATINGAKVCNTGPTPTAGVYTASIPSVPIPAGSRLRVTIHAAQVVTSTSRIVYGGVAALGADYSDSGVVLTTGTLQ